jgi:hypothetical protein
MAYTGNTLSYMYGGPIEGAFKLWAYISSEATIAAVEAAGYFSDGVTCGMQVGDMIIVSNPSTLGAAGLLQVTSVSGNAATALNVYPNA